MDRVTNNMEDNKFRILSNWYHGRSNTSLGGPVITGVGIISSKGLVGEW